MGHSTHLPGSRACTSEGCTKPHLAKGYCSTHYSQRRHATQGPNTGKQQFSCGTCGKLCWKAPRASLNYVARYCSTACLAKARQGRCQRIRDIVGPIEPAWCAVPAAHPSLRPITPARVFASGRCRYCNAWFTDRQRQARYCSDRCARRWHKREHKTRNGDQVATEVRAEVYRRDKSICQLCFEPVDKTLPRHHPWGATLDHIECQSWALIPDHRASNLRLAHRMCNSLRGDRTA